MLTFSQLPDIIHGTLLQPGPDAQVQQLLTDSRNLAQPANSVFFAINGQFNDGHLYVSALYARGVRMFVIEELANIPGMKSESGLPLSFPDAGFIKVKSSLKALQELAQHHRQQFNLPVFGITGSNGKTIVKEWLAQLLTPDEKVVKSPRSYNSQIGVPLSVWQIAEQDTLGIFEAGISQPGEMEKLEAIIKPTFGIFTNIGPAHDEGFLDMTEKIAEKLKLFVNAELLFYCAEETRITTGLAGSNLKTFTWGYNSNADIRIIKSPSTETETTITYIWQEKENQLKLPFTDAASRENALHCLAVLAYRNVAPEEMQQRFSKLQAVAMRLEMKEAINNCYLIDDTYNNDLAGLATALDLLMNQKRHQKRTVILSDLLEAGLPEEVLYAQLAEALQSRHINRLIGIGKVISRHRFKFAMGTEFYESTAEFLEHFRPDQFQNETILVKGARVFGFEKIVALFGQKVHGTVLEVNLNALVHNLNFYRAKLKPETKIMVMVKAFAYGSGSYEIANLLQYHRVDYLAVAYADEGISLRDNGISLPVMVMNPSPDSFVKIRKYHLEPEMYSLNLLRNFTDFVKSEPAGIFNIHLKLDTGMHRLGFTEEDLDELVSILAAEPRLKVVSIFSHLAGADEALHNDFSQQQIANFRRMAETLETKLGYSVIKHILNSAGIVRFPEHQLDMVRLGIGLYGIEASGTEQGNLQNVGSLKTTISQIKHIKEGDTIGYSRKGVAEKDLTIATLAIGYADGYDRGFSNGVGQVLINGHRAPIIGNVCMDMCMVDITGLENIKEGDEVQIFGANVSISDLAKKINTIPYELLTSVSPRVRRVFFSE